MHGLEGDRAQPSKTIESAHASADGGLVIGAAATLANPLHQPPSYPGAPLHVIEPVLERGAADIGDQDLHSDFLSLNCNCTRPFLSKSIKIVHNTPRGSLYIRRKLVEQIKGALCEESLGRLGGGCVRDDGSGSGAAAIRQCAGQPDVLSQPLGARLRGF